MAHWWVNLGETYKDEVKGFMWSPQMSARGRLQSYENMTVIQPGDTIFAFADTYLKAIGIATSTAQASQKPNFGSRGKHWHEEGWLVEVQFTELSQPIKIRDHMDLIAPTLPPKYSPLQANGNGVQSYLFSVPEQMALALAVILGEQYQQILAQPVSLNAENDDSDVEASSIDMRFDLSVTEKLQLTKSRRGQGLFKANVRLIEAACRVTGVTQISMLRASHIKPWSVADDVEKIDGFNGLLLAPHVDHLFDRGYISFESSGEMHLSPRLDLTILNKWHIPEVLNVGSFNSDQAEYLTYHQNEVFQATA